MPIKVLIINSSPEKNYLLCQVFKELEQKNIAFSLWSSKINLINKFKQNFWPAKKIFLGPDLNSRKNIIFFIAALIFFQLKFFIALLSLKIKHQVDSIVCLNINEKIITAVPAKLLGIKTIWLESPEINYRLINKFLLRLYKLNHAFAKVAAFSYYTKTQLANLGFNENKILVILPGAKINHYQVTIFNKLANLSQANFHKKYFTVGVITALDQRQKIETVFQAIKNCLPVIPNLQLIVIGDGKERKNLVWLSKKMEIENLIWLVGDQEQLKKWLDSFDVYLCVNDAAKLDDYGNILEAMACGLPVLGQRNIGLEDVIMENKTGALIESDNNEMLARQIIKLHQDKKLRLHLVKNGRERVNQSFTLNAMADELSKCLIN